MYGRYKKKQHCLTLESCVVLITNIISAFKSYSFFFYSDQTRSCCEIMYKYTIGYPYWKSNNSFSPEAAGVFLLSRITVPCRVSGIPKKLSYKITKIRDPLAQKHKHKPSSEHPGCRNRRRSSYTFQKLKLIRANATRLVKFAAQASEFSLSPFSGRFPPFVFHFYARVRITVSWTIAKRLQLFGP